MEFLIVLGAGVIILGIGCIIATIRVKRGGQGIPNWPDVTGTVVDAFVYHHERKTTESTTETFTPVIEYTYSVRGQAYTSSKQGISPYFARSYQDRGQAEAVVRAYPVNSAVTVRYNPSNPKQAVLKAPKALAHNAVLLYGVVNVLMGIGAIALAFVIR